MMEIEKEPSPNSKANASNDQNMADAESQITFLRLKLKLLVKESNEQYDEVKRKENETSALTSSSYPLYAPTTFSLVNKFVAFCIRAFLILL